MPFIPHPSYVHEMPVVRKSTARRRFHAARLGCIQRVVVFSSRAHGASVARRRSNFPRSPEVFPFGEESVAGAPIAAFTCQNVRSNKGDSWFPKWVAVSIRRFCSSISPTETIFAIGARGFRLATSRTGRRDVHFGGLPVRVRL